MLLRKGTFGVDGLFTGLPVKHQLAPEMPSYAVMCECCRAAKGSAFLAEVEEGKPCTFLSACTAVEGLLWQPPPSLQTLQQPCPINAVKPTALP